MWPVVSPCTATTDIGCPLNWQICSILLKTTWTHRPLADVGKPCWQEVHARVHTDWINLSRSRYWKYFRPSFTRSTKMNWHSCLFLTWQQQSTSSIIVSCDRGYRGNSELMEMSLNSLIYSRWEITVRASCWYINNATKAHPWSPARVRSLAVTFHSIHCWKPIATPAPTPPLHTPTHLPLPLHLQHDRPTDRLRPRSRPLLNMITGLLFSSRTDQPIRIE